MILSRFVFGELQVYLSWGRQVVAFDRVIGSMAERLYGDERLRSNLDDTEAQVILDWALARLTQIANASRDEGSARIAVQADLPRVRAVVMGLNDVARKRGALYSRQVTISLQPLVEPNRFITRPDLERLLATLAQAAKGNR